jgi:hypothetical protein
MISIFPAAIFPKKLSIKYYKSANSIYLSDSAFSQKINRQPVKFYDEILINLRSDEITNASIKNSLNKLAERTRLN